MAEHLDAARASGPLPVPADDVVALRVAVWLRQVAATKPDEEGGVAHRRRRRRKALTRRLQHLARDGQQAEAEERDDVPPPGERGANASHAEAALAEQGSPLRR